MPPTVASCAEAKKTSPNDGNYLLSIASPPTAVYCVMGKKKDAPTTYLQLPATGAANPVRSLWPVN